MRTHGPLRQRNSGSARLHNISVAVEEDATVFVVCKLSSKLVVRLTIHGDKDRRLEVGPWSLDVVAYVVAVLLRRESGCRPLAGIDTQPRTLDVLVIDDPLAVRSGGASASKRSLNAAALRSRSPWPNV